MNTAIEDFTHDYNCAVKSYNDGDYVSFLRHIRPTIERLCVLIIRDCSEDDELAEDIISGDKAIDFDRNTKEYRISYYSSNGKPKGSSWINAARNSFAYKFQMTKIDSSIERSIRTFFEDFHRFYSISSSTAQHFGQNKLDISIQSIACASCFAAFFDFIRAYKLLSDSIINVFDKLYKIESEEDAKLYELEKELETERALKEKAILEKNESESKLADVLSHNTQDKESMSQIQELLNKAIQEKTESNSREQIAKEEIVSLSQQLSSAQNELKSKNESLDAALFEIETLKAEINKAKESSDTDSKIEEEEPEVTLDNLFDMTDEEPEEDEEEEDYLDQFDLSDYQRNFVNKLLPLVEEELSVKEMAENLNIKAQTVIDRLSFMIEKSIIQLDYILKRQDIQDILYILRQTGLDSSIRSINSKCYYKHSSEDIQLVIAVCQKQGTMLSPVLPPTNKEWKFVSGLKLRGMSKTIFNRKIKIGMNEKGYYIKDGEDYIKIADAQPGFSLFSGSIHIHSAESYYSFGQVIKHSIGKNNEVQIGWIREEDTRVVFTSMNKTEYYYTWK